MNRMDERIDLATTQDGRNEIHRIESDRHRIENHRDRIEGISNYRSITDTDKSSYATFQDTPNNGDTLHLNEDEDDDKGIEGEGVGDKDRGEKGMKNGNIPNPSFLFRTSSRFTILYLNLPYTTVLYNFYYLTICLYLSLLFKHYNPSLS